MRAALVRFWIQPGSLAVAFHGVCRRLWLSKVPGSRQLSRLLHYGLGPFVEAWTGVYLPPQVHVGQRLEIHHRGKVVVNEASIIGDDCVLLHGVTLGNRRPGGGAPTLGDRVEVGAYAQLLGPISIGNDVRIGALAVVLDDVPDGATVVAAKAVVRLRNRQP